MNSRARMVVVLALALITIAPIAVAAWRVAAQRVNLVIVNQSGVAATLTWEPGLFAPRETVPINGCEAKSLELAGGQYWRLQSDALDVNARFVDRPWLTPMVKFEIWLEQGGGSRIVGPDPVDGHVDAPIPSGCVPG